LEQHSWPDFDYAGTFPRVSADVTPAGFTTAQYFYPAAELHASLSAPHDDTAKTKRAARRLIILSRPCCVVVSYAPSSTC
jgi:hypothetical protein